MSGPGRRLVRLTRHVAASQPSMAAAGKVEEGGGVSRVASSAGEAAGIARVNSMSDADLTAALIRCCTAPEWAARVCAVRPFKSVESMLEAADALWWQCGEAQWRAGFAGHAKLGSKKAEQKAAMSEAKSETIDALTRAVQDYERRVGFPCIIYAAGRSADTLRDIVHQRLKNPPETELRVAAEQVMMITRLRMETLVFGEGNVPARGDGRSPITTHVLDTASGRPGRGVQLRLEIQGVAADGASEWRPLSSGVTNADGRVADLLPPTYNLRKGVYRVVFNVEGYFTAQGQETFFPEVTIAFKLGAPTEHYHVPLLLSPYGYTTYRGS